MEPTPRSEHFRITPGIAWRRARQPDRQRSRKSCSTTAPCRGNSWLTRAHTILVLKPFLVVSLIYEFSPPTSTVIPVVSRLARFSIRASSFSNRADHCHAGFSREAPLRQLKYSTVRLHVSESLEIAAQNCFPHYVSHRRQMTAQPRAARLHALVSQYFAAPG